VLSKGSKDKAAVSALKKRLIELGYQLDDSGANKGVFGVKVEAAVKDVQLKNGLLVDGKVGMFTERALALDPTKNPVRVVDKGDYFGAPWVGANIDLLGRDETDPELNKRYVPEWKLEGLPGYKTLAGNTHAWCSVRENADKRKVGVKGTNSAAAASWSRWGYKCPFWFGATLDIRHRSGGRHVATFLYWVDEKKKIAAALGGNQGNKFSIVPTNLSGSGDTLVAGPRWSHDWPAGQLVSKEEVLKAYPFLKVGGKGGGSTT